MLKRLNVLADEAYNGYDAIEKCKHFKYSIILMDLNMPGMNGLEASKEIHRIYNTEIYIV